MGGKTTSVCKFTFVISILVLISIIHLTGNVFADDFFLSYFAPASISIVSGDNQSGEAGTALPEPLVVEVLRKSRHPASMVQVKFTVITGGGTVTRNVRRDPAGKTTVNVRTDSEGRASVTLIAGNARGVNEVEARVESLDPVIFTVTVANSPPELNPIGNRQVNEGSELSFTVSATDPDPDDTVVLSASGLPANATFTPSTGVFSFTPDYTQSGICPVTFFASDGFLMDSETVTITVQNVNRPPVLNPIGNWIVDENTEITIVVSAVDPDGDVLTFSSPDMPPGAVLEQQQNAPQCTFRWTPGFDTVTVGDSLVFSVTFIVNDPWGGSDSKQALITVRDAEPPPEPDILALPPVMDFGAVTVGESADRAFLVYNNGNDLLKIFQIVPTDPQFAILAYSQIDGMFVAVTYSEVDSQFVVAEYIETDDPLSITAYSEASGMFVTVTYSEDNHQFVIAEYLEVDGQLSATVYSETVGEFAAAAYSETDPRFVDVVYPDIAPGGSLLIVSRFTPISGGPKAGQIFIVSDDPDEPVVQIDVQGEATQTPNISVSPSSIDFGTVEMGQSSDKVLTIINNGDGPLNIHDIISDDPQFTVSGYSNVAPSSQIAVTVTFTPSSPGQKDGTLNVVSDDPDEPVVPIPLQGEGLEIPVPDILVSPTSMDFGDVEVGQSSQAELDIYNNGNGELQVHNIIPGDPQFSVSAYSNVDPSDKITVTVTFTPSSEGAETATLSIVSDDPDQPVVQVALQGNGIITLVPDIYVWPSILNIGDVELGESSDTRFWIFNYGDAVLQISSITSNNVQFTVLADSDVPPGGVAVILVRFTPASTGSKVGVITIASNDPDEPTETVSVYGRGVITTLPDIRVSPASLDFGEVTMGGSSDKKIKIYNDGGVTLQISSIASNNGQFAALSDPNIPPGQMIEVTIRFTPSSIGTKNGTITIASNDPDEPTVLVSVEGEGIYEPGPDIYAAPHTMNFGEVEIGESSELSFYIYNFGDELLQIYSMTSSSGDFQILGHSNVPPESSVEIWVRFTPSSLGTETGHITIHSNDPDEPTVTVSLSGVGIPPEFPIIGDWQVISQQGLMMDFYDVNFVNDDGWAVGYGGTVVHSDDGGSTWALQPTPTGSMLRGVYFTSSSNGWAVGRYGTMLRTNNGGYSWTAWSSGVSASLNAVQFVGSNRGWIAGEAGTILATTNGYTWNLQDSGTQFPLNDVCFVSSYRGWVVGSSGVILHTTNGGQTWLQQNSGTTVTLRGVNFVDYYEGWAVGNSGTVLHTEDGGQTWERQTNGVPYAILTDVDFINFTEGWAVGYGGVMLYTEDGGVTWVRVSNVVNENLWAVQFRDADNGWAVGMDSAILKYSPETVPPSITSVNVYGSPASTGDVIEVVATGQPGNQASFSITGVVSHVAMTENPAGTYTGSYIVEDGVNEHGTRVIVALRNQYGDVDLDMSKSVDIDTVASINWASVTPAAAKADDIITAAMGGESAGTATFSIQSVAANIPMTEDPNSPGSYVGQYIVPLGVNLSNAEVTVKLVDTLGNVDTKSAGQLKIDTTVQIASVSVTGSPAMLGDPIIVTLMAEGGGSAEFFISGLASGVPMSENQSGIYTGIYTAQQGIHIEDAVVTVQFTDAVGNSAERDAGRVTIDTGSLIGSVNVSGSPAKADELIGVAMFGESGGAAKFSIAGVVDDIPMTEGPSGMYTGTYTVMDGVNVTDAVVTVTLTDSVGNVNTDANQAVTIDTTVPEVISVDMSGSPAKAGETITLVVVGEPGLSVQFFIDGVIDNAPMPEEADQPGTYTGTYVAADGVNVADVVITITLTDSVGNISINASQRATIDTAIPGITSVSIYDDPAKVGETITVTVTGEAGGAAQFAIAGVAENVPMIEDAENPGTYTGTYDVTDDAPYVTDALVTVTLEDIVGNVGSDSSASITIVPSWDVNGDGSIDAADLVVIGTYFGQDVPEGNDADVNGDGVVDILDVIIVSKHFGTSENSASPGKGAKVTDPDQLAILRDLYDSLEGGGDNTMVAKRILAELIGLPAVRITESRLMQNYPNPCNPETWIPYDLADPGSVIIRIYSPTGRLVRTLDLGHSLAGSYSDKSKAAYWNGTNESGEEVASGLYFYSITSGDFNAVRKMTVSR